jgi:hypothetical protein
MQVGWRLSAGRGKLGPRHPLSRWDAISKGDAHAQAQVPVASSVPGAVVRGPSSPESVGRPSVLVRDPVLGLRHPTLLAGRVLPSPLLRHERSDLLGPLLVGALRTGAHAGVAGGADANCFLPLEASMGRRKLTVAHWELPLRLCKLVSDDGSLPWNSVSFHRARYRRYRRNHATLPAPKPSLFYTHLALQPRRGAGVKPGVSTPGTRRQTL